MARRFGAGRARVLAVFIAVAAIAAVTSAAWAVIPNAEGTIQACYARDGYLRVIDTDEGQTCRTKEQALEWSAAPSQLPNAFVDLRLGGRVIPAGSTGVEVASLDLPAGSYLVTAKIAVNSRGTALDNSVRMGCALVAGDSLAEQDGASLHLAPVGHPGEQGVITLLTNAEHSAASSASLRCSASGNESGVSVSSVIRAFEAGSITTHIEALTPSP